MKRCDICGVELKIVNSKYFCPNCGLKEMEKEKNGDNEANYIG